MKKNISNLLFAFVFISFVFALLFHPVNASGSTIQELYDKVQALEKEGDYTQAVQTARELISLAPDNDLYLAYASHVERLAGSFENGLKHALAAIQINPNVPWYYASAAFNAYGSGDLKLAKKFSKKVMELGIEQAGQGNYDNAKAIIKNLADRKYEITWNLDPAKGAAKGNYYYIPIPTSNLPYQTAQYQVTGATGEKQVREEGNDLVYFKPAEGESFRMTAKIQVRAYSYKQLLARYQDSDNIPDDVKVYLGPSEGINPQSTIIKNIAAGLKRPKKLDTVKNILAWMKKNIRYQIEDFKNVEEIVERGYGECGCWSALFTALCRAAGIPARGVWGVVEDSTPDRRFAPEGHLKGHAWAEFYLAGIGWVPVEPQSIETLGLLPTSYVRMYHYDVKSKHWSAPNFRASDNLVIMGGDTPEFRDR
jgi:transglutaminase-like putative cysteine protease